MASQRPAQDVTKTGGEMRAPNTQAGERQGAEPDIPVASRDPAWGAWVVLGGLLAVVIVVVVAVQRFSGAH